MTHKFRTQVEKHLLSRSLSPSPIFPPAPARLQPRPVIIRRALGDAGYADKCVARLQLPVGPGHQRLGRDGRWLGGAEQVTETSTACRPPCARWRHGSSRAAVTRTA